jgi:hypothetical protein
MRIPVSSTAGMRMQDDILLLDGGWMAHWTGVTVHACCGLLLLIVCMHPVNTR